MLLNIMVYYRKINAKELPFSSKYLCSAFSTINRNYLLAITKANLTFKEVYLTTIRLY